MQNENITIRVDGKLMSKLDAWRKLQEIPVSRAAVIRAALDRYLVETTANLKKVAGNPRVHHLRTGKPPELYRLMCVYCGDSHLPGTACDASSTSPSEEGEAR